jgi:hypothetical protein
VTKTSRPTVDSGSVEGAFGSRERSRRSSGDPQTEICRSNETPLELEHDVMIIEAMIQEREERVQRNMTFM